MTGFFVLEEGLNPYSNTILYQESVERVEGRFQLIEVIELVRQFLYRLAG